MVSEVVTSRPPLIAARNLMLPATVAVAMDESTREISALDSTHGEHLEPLGVLLLRTESVASSKIEQVEASLEDYARALHGIKSNPSATSMVASTTALHSLVAAVSGGQGITLDMVLGAHRALMADDTHERAYAGRVRDMQNWIGGSDYSPRNAMYVPPPPETVHDYLNDLLVFANRDDMPAMAQGAVVHAQFESIHPFTDGNGRIGRALINAVLRRRGVTERLVVPLASALVARRDNYFDVLNLYRAGDAAPIIVAFSKASQIAAQESRVTGRRIAQLPDRWAEAAGHPRRGSAPRKILEGLLGQPIFSTEDVESRIGAATSSVYAAVERLREAGVLRPLTDRKRNQVWGATDLLDELDDLSVRIAGRVHAEG